MTTWNLITITIRETIITNYKFHLDIKFKINSCYSEPIITSSCYDKPSVRSRDKFGDPYTQAQSLTPTRRQYHTNITNNSKSYELEAIRNSEINKKLFFRDNFYYQFQSVLTRLLNCFPWANRSQDLTYNLFVVSPYSTFDYNEVLNA